MKQTKKERIALLKSTLDIGNNELANKAKISAVTVWNIEKGESVSAKTDRSIIKAFNLNRDWWHTGKGEMFSSQPAIEEETSVNPWKDEAYINLKSQLDYWQNKYDQLFDAVVSGKLGKLLALELAGEYRLSA